jgi:alkanesulfonate monooxygenase SsuD/methylene tetrahydromethanopterin reductase-like flavin-dependent oxidoreductase (luciferase family)
MNKITLGILDLGHRENTDSLSSVMEIIEYAQKAESLFFSRFWLGEHHSQNQLMPYTNPDILISIIAGMTESIRVGSAGSLVKMYSPYSLVTNYKLLNNLYSDRIDLGLSKGNPDTNYTRNNLFDINDSFLFTKKIQEIHSLLHNEKQNFDKEEIVIPPYGGSIPDVWYLSNSYKNFEDVIRFKLNFCRSIFHGKNSNKSFDKEELFKYKNLFLKTNGFPPKISLALGIVIGETLEEAEEKNRIDKNGQLIDLNSDLNILPVTIDSLFDLISRYQNLYGIDEFILYDVETDNRLKIKNIEMISDKFKLLNYKDI